jgi:hypothetical protein
MKKRGSIPQASTYKENPKPKGGLEDHLITFRRYDSRFPAFGSLLTPGARLPLSFLIGKSVDLATPVRICLEALFPPALFPEPERSKEGRAMMILRSHRTERKTIEKLNLSLRVKRCDPSRRSTSLSHSRKKGVARTASRKKWSSRFKGKKLCSLLRSVPANKDR